MKLFSFFIVMLISFLFFSCSPTPIVTTHPLGTEPIKIVAKEWDGIWTDQNDILSFKVTDEEKGKMDAKFLSQGSDDSFFFKMTFHSTIKQYKGTTYINFSADSTQLLHYLKNNKENNDDKNTFFDITMDTISQCNKNLPNDKQITDWFSVYNYSFSYRFIKNGDAIIFLDYNHQFVENLMDEKIIKIRGCPFKGDFLIADSSEKISKILEKYKDDIFSLEKINTVFIRKIKN